MAVENIADAEAVMREQEAQEAITAFVKSQPLLRSQTMAQYIRSAESEIEYYRRYKAVVDEAKRRKETKETRGFLHSEKLEMYSPPRQETAFGQHTVVLYVDGKKIIRKMGPWELRNGRIIRDTERGVRVACRCPVLIIGKLADTTSGTEYVDIAWQKPGEGVRRRIVPQAAIASKSEILKLAAVGFPAESDIAGDLVSYLADMAAYDTEIKKRSCTSQYGWDEELTHFAPYDDDVIFYDQTQTLLSRSIRKSGSYDEWMTMMCRIRNMNRMEPRICMAAAFAAPLVQIAGGQTGIVNLSRESGAGKSLSMMCGASIYGYPKSGHLVIDASSTNCFSESAMGVMKSLPAFFDDLSQAKNPDSAVSDMVYKICREATRGRMSDKIVQRSIYTWQTIAQTNYERDLATLDMNGGVFNRVYDYHCDLGDIISRNTNPTATEVAETLLKNYGHAGRVWIKELERLGADNIRARIRKMRKELDDAVKKAGEAPKSGKQLEILVFVLVADELSEELIFKDKILLDRTRMLRDCKSEEDVFEPAIAYDKLGDLVQINMAHFTAGKDSTIDRFGTINGNLVDINREVMVKWGKDHSFDPSGLCRWLLGSHPTWIETTTEKGKRRYLKRIDAKGTYAYRIRLWQDTDADKKAPEVVTEEQAKRARMVLDSIYNVLPMDTKEKILEDPVLTRIMRGLGFEINMEEGSLELRPEVLAKLDYIDLKNGKKAGFQDAPPGVSPF